MRHFKFFGGVCLFLASNSCQGFVALRLGPSPVRSLVRQSNFPTRTTFSIYKPKKCKFRMLSEQQDAMEGIRNSMRNLQRDILADFRGNTSGFLFKSAVAVVSASVLVNIVGSALLFVLLPAVAVTSFIVFAATAQFIFMMAAVGSLLLFAAPVVLAPISVAFMALPLLGVAWLLSSQAPALLNSVDDQAQGQVNGVGSKNSEIIDVEYIEKNAAEEDLRAFDERLGTKSWNAANQQQQELSLNTERLVDILALYGLSEYATVFRRNRIDGKVAKSLTEEELINMGVLAIGDRKRMIALFKSLSQ